MKVIKDNLLHFNLSIKQCRGQCYDGASSTSGRHSSTAVQITSEAPRALYTHCYRHAINLEVGKTQLSSKKLLRDALDVYLAVALCLRK